MAGFTYIVLAITLLVVPGVLYNNASNSGLVVNGGTIGNCDNNLDICNITNSVGCQANPSYCSLNGQTISFLSGASPFTGLLQGNLFALFQPIQSPSTAPTYGPFDLVGGGTFYYANCDLETSANPGYSLDYWIYFCTQANTDGSNMTYAQTNKWTNWNPNLVGSNSTIHFYNIITNTTGSNRYQLETASGTQFNFSASNSYTWIAANYYAKGGASTNCDTIGASNPACPPLYKSYSFLLRVPNYQFVSGYLLKYHCDANNPTYWCVKVGQVPVQLTTSWTPLGCQEAVFLGDFWRHFSWGFSQQCTNWENSVTTQAGSISSTQGYGVLAPIITFLIGLVLLFIGLGIQIGGSGSIIGSGVSGQVGTNRQGTKLAQVIGIGLIIWSVLYSEFSGWFTSGILPYGLDGTLGVISLIVSGIMFFGMYQWATTD